MKHRWVYTATKASSICLLAVSCICAAAHSQELPVDSSFAHGSSSVTGEIQVYPTGLIYAVGFERFFSDRNAWHVRLAGQVIRHEDFGEFDDERGTGFGASVGYRRFWRNSFSVGVRLDIFQNDLDWIDNEGEPGERRGNTDVTVLQPTLEVTYRRALSKNWYIQPSLAVGAEINIITRGEDTGQGFIPLIGLSIGRSVF